MNALNTKIAHSRSQTAILDALDGAGERALASRSNGIHLCPHCNGTEDILSIKLETGNNTLLWCSCGAVSLNGHCYEKKAA